MSNLPPYQNQPQVSPSPPPSPYQNSMGDKSPMPAPNFVAQAPPPSGQVGPAPPGAYGAQPVGPASFAQVGPAPPGQPGPYGVPPGQYPAGPAGPQPVQFGAPAQYGAPMMAGQYGMPPYMMPNLVQPDQLKGKDYSCLVKCPQCQITGMTNVKKESNVIMVVLYIIFLILGILVPPFIIFLIPAFIFACFTTYQVHECTRCSYKISSENKSCVCC